MAQRKHKTSGELLLATAPFALVAVIAFLIARIVWAVVTPVGPFGEANGRAEPVSLAPLAAIDPFFRQAKADSSAVVTGLPLRLFGTRLDDVTGQSSAIIATPDGLQSSYVIGEAVMPGVKLASVARDGVTIDRGGVMEKLFLDQSVSAPIVTPPSSASAQSQALYPPAQPVSPPPAAPPLPTPIVQAPGVAP